VFKNPEGPSWKRENGPRTAGQLIEAAGLKGFSVGGAQVSPMHANYFVNTGTATAAEVRKLIEHAQKVVRERFGVRLELEVKLIGSRGEYLNSVNGER
jgi:UDP-N-acetylmuramate dehydrogenase